MVEYSGPESVAAAMPSLIFSQTADDDRIYLQCDGPDRHWLPYRFSELETES